jgi:hypothetical protein
MKAGRIWVAAIAAAAVLATAPAATAKPASSPALAQRNAPDQVLASEFLRLLQARDMTGLERFLANAFLLQRPDGTHLTKTEYLANPATVGGFSLSDVVGTRSGNVRVIRYTVTALETIDGQTVTRDPVSRLSTYVWRGGGWRLVGHANFTAVPRP